mmetsp:Transcript_893/g.1401  ORF Transcript_893/g.1401 Transcript_893/m.1401 type:complete len:119 (+) Transcript_893:116-472(+)|eukprot:CAMPEP_0115058520 /NCGR_PEP_ID=MMETSP0227-20121206/6391_1 /TAXON_ID=89957 /ORGANISM="Polarella glacialis, Strain CCMP 1383" /LENGTH=118 /DNA_ID=CAMNT_0002443507 /DNA_START=36 /DNA_END=392 /DNA_ORIENTATION=-
MAAVMEQQQQPNTAMAAALEPNPFGLQRSARRSDTSDSDTSNAFVTRARRHEDTLTAHLRVNFEEHLQAQLRSRNGLHEVMQFHPHMFEDRASDEDEADYRDDGGFEGTEFADSGSDY